MRIASATATVTIAMVISLGGCADNGSTSTESDAAAADTGRLSDSEYSYIETVLGQFEAESEDFTGGIQRCATIASAGQLAEAADCFDEAYDGLEGDAGYAYNELSDLLGDTRGRCRRTIIGLRRALDRFTTSMQQAHEIGSNLIGDAALGREVGTRMTEDSISYLTWHTRLIRRCAPR